MRKRSQRPDNADDPPFHVHCRVPSPERPDAHKTANTSVRGPRAEPAKEPATTAFRLSRRHHSPYVGGGAVRLSSRPYMVFMAIWRQEPFRIATTIEMIIACP